MAVPVEPMLLLATHNRKTKGMFLMFNQTAYVPPGGWSKFF